MKDGLADAESDWEAVVDNDDDNDTDLDMDAGVDVGDAAMQVTVGRHDPELLTEGDADGTTHVRVVGSSSYPVLQAEHAPVAGAQAEHWRGRVHAWHTDTAPLTVLNDPAGHCSPLALPEPPGQYDPGGTLQLRQDSVLLPATRNDPATHRLQMEPALAWPYPLAQVRHVNATGSR
jgi:hypothetical protein